jgi:hypothetical protein
MAGKWYQVLDDILGGFGVIRAIKSPLRLQGLWVVSLVSSHIVFGENQEDTLSKHLEEQGVGMKAL